MSEANLVARTGAAPPTVETLARDLAALGVAPGDVLLVHCALSSLGWVVGGAPAVVAAVTRAVGPDGTIAMPTQSGHLTDPAEWQAPPVPREWLPVIRANMPAFDPATTPTRRMGVVAENFRTHPGALRSRHPHVSFAARGPRAAEITAGHGYDDGMGENSPLARLYDLDASVLLLGVGHARNTSLHLAEHRAAWPSKERRTVAGPILVDGRRQWATFSDIDFDDGDFDDIGHAYEIATGAVAVGPVGRATARLMRQRPLVDFAARWMAANRR
ncbi:MAG: AAC(3) family N-acetyltransferase [Rhodospirillales bacterium]|nr:AAC(3) family N-acetyltransferase [Rhodospirillales bacterium]